MNEEYITLSRNSQKADDLLRGFFETGVRPQIVDTYESSENQRVVTFQIKSTERKPRQRDRFKLYLEALRIPELTFGVGPAIAIGLSQYNQDLRVLPLFMMVVCVICFQMSLMLYNDIWQHIKLQNPGWTSPGLKSLRLGHIKAHRLIDFSKILIGIAFVCGIGLLFYIKSWTYFTAAGIALFFIADFVFDWRLRRKIGTESVGALLAGPLLYFMTADLLQVKMTPAHFVSSIILGHLIFCYYTSRALESQMSGAQKMNLSSLSRLPFDRLWWTLMSSLVAIPVLLLIRAYFAGTFLSYTLVILAGGLLVPIVSRLYRTHSSVSSSVLDLHDSVIQLHFIISFSFALTQLH